MGSSASHSLPTLRARLARAEVSLIAPYLSYMRQDRRFNRARP